MTMSDNMTVRQLRELAKSKGLKGYTSMTKAQLVKSLCKPKSTTRSKIKKKKASSRKKKENDDGITTETLNANKLLLIDLMDQTTIER